MADPSKQTQSAADPNTLAGAPELLDDRYKVAGWLGDGASSEVLHAHDRALGHDVVLKVLRPRFAAPKQDEYSERVRRFRRRASIGARMDHPGIPTVFDAGEIWGGMEFVSMAVAPGVAVPALAALYGDTMPEGVVLSIGDQVASALAHVDGLGFVHRDVSPRNVLVSTDKRARLIDFGDAIEIGATEPTRVGPMEFRSAAELRDEPADLDAIGVAP